MKCISLRARRWPGRRWVYYSSWQSLRWLRSAFGFCVAAFEGNLSAQVFFDKPVGLFAKFLRKDVPQVRMLHMDVRFGNLGTNPHHHTIHALPFEIGVA